MKEGISNPPVRSGASQHRRYLCCMPHQLVETKSAKDSTVPSVQPSLSHKKRGIHELHCNPIKHSGTPISPLISASSHPHQQILASLSMGIYQEDLSLLHVARRCRDEQAKENSRLHTISAALLSLAGSGPHVELSYLQTHNVELQEPRVSCKPPDLVGGTQTYECPREPASWIEVLQARHTDSSWRPLPPFRVTTDRETAVRLASVPNVSDSFHIQNRDVGAWR
ncbi:hypothetical protein F4818DRAFT_398942 [Hypoxylon cercidicola]|nr:hypothetical protein F4818DRAFT_398942 [Hypoxylon cercidicola]